MLRFKKITKLAESQAREWNNLWERSPDAHFFNSPDYFSAFVEAFAPEQYLIIFCYDSEELITVLPLLKSKKFGVSSWACPDRPKNYLDRTSLLISDNAPEHIGQIVGYLRSLGNVFFADCPEHISKMLLANVRCFPGESIVCPRTKIGDDVLSNMSGKQKREMKRRIRKSKSHLDFKYLTGDLDNQLEEIIEIEKNSEKFAKGIALFDHSDARKLYRSIIKTSPQGAAIGMLYFDSLPIASMFGLFYKNTFLGTHMAFRSDFWNLGPGKMLCYFVLEELRRRNIQTFDFSKGDGRLKREFTDEFPIQRNIYLPKNRLVLAWWKFMIKAKKLAKHLLLSN